VCEVSHFEKCEPTSSLKVDDKGEVVEQAWVKIGILYMRKSAFERGKAWPQELRVTVDVVD
jgi:hypothetical protein